MIRIDKCHTNDWEILGLFDYDCVSITPIVTKQELEQLKDLITAALQDNDLTTQEKENVYDR